MLLCQQLHRTMLRQGPAGHRRNRRGGRVRGLPAGAAHITHDGAALAVLLRGPGHSPGQQEGPQGVQQSLPDDRHAEDVDPGGGPHEHLHLLPVGVAAEEPRRHGYGPKGRLQRRTRERGEETEGSVLRCVPAGLHLAPARSASGEDGDENPDEPHQQADAHDRQDFPNLRHDGEAGAAADHAEEDELAEDPNPAHDALHLPEDAPV
mmetsp:Transcript_96360/g.287565  ORF Transcript_96360/g.287565 Transcript_96360/m.287565 type:complete len:207 (-) Transcript_96360:555-1175(-)